MITFSKPSLSNLRPLTNESYLDLHNSTATTSGLKSSICCFTASTLLEEMWAVPNNRRLPFTSTNDEFEIISPLYEKNILQYRKGFFHYYTLLLLFILSLLIKDDIEGNLAAAK